MWNGLLEPILLLAAIGFLIPIPPSDPSAISFFLIALLSSICFFGSRFLRRQSAQRSRTMALASLETSVFLSIAYLIDLCANIVLPTYR